MPVAVYDLLKLGGFQRRGLLKTLELTNIHLLLYQDLLRFVTHWKI